MGGVGGGGGGRLKVRLKFKQVVPVSKAMQSTARLLLPSYSKL